MKIPRMTLLVTLAAGGLAGCGVTSEATSVPFDLASTTGDAATSASSSGDDNADSAQLEAERYVAEQLDWIRRDAARGDGAHLRALALLLGEQDPAAFGQRVRRHYPELFTDLDAAEELLARLETLPR